MLIDERATPAIAFAHSAADVSRDRTSVADHSRAARDVRCRKPLLLGLTHRDFNREIQNRTEIARWNPVAQQFLELDELLVSLFTDGRVNRIPARSNGRRS